MRWVTAILLVVGASVAAALGYGDMAALEDFAAARPAAICAELR